MKAGPHGVISKTLQEFQAGVALWLTQDMYWQYALCHTRAKIQNVTTTEGTRSTVSDLSISKLGRPKGSTNEAQQERKQKIDDLKANITNLYYKMQTSDLAGIGRMKSGQLEQLIIDKKKEYDLEDINIPKQTIKN